MPHDNETITWTIGGHPPTTLKIAQGWQGHEYIESHRSVDVLAKTADGRIIIGWYDERAGYWRTVDMDEQGYGYLDHVQVSVVA